MLMQLFFSFKNGIFSKRRIWNAIAHVTELEMAFVGRKVVGTPKGQRLACSWESTTGPSLRPLGRQTARQCISGVSSSLFFLSRLFSSCLPAPPSPLPMLRVSLIPMGGAWDPTCWCRLDIRQWGVFLITLLLFCSVHFLSLHFFLVLKRYGEQTAFLGPPGTVAFELQLSPDQGGTSKLLHALCDFYFLRQGNDGQVRVTELNKCGLMGEAVLAVLWRLWAIPLLSPARTPPPGGGVSDWFFESE